MLGRRGASPPAQS